MLQTVILGPHVDLHPGIHGSLINDPPDDISYHQRGGRHHFLLNRNASGADQLSPFSEPHLGELLDFGPGPQVVHAARWPVANRRAWVADMDDFGYPMLLGRYAVKASMRDGSDGPWDEELAEVAHRRTARMLEAYAHPSCKAILFRTGSALREAESWLHRLDLLEEGGPFLAKARVLYPAQRATLLPTRVEAKWQHVPPVRVLFVGNDYQIKNGRSTLRIFRRLKSLHPDVQFTYVGMVPDQDLDLTEGVDFRGPLNRKEVLVLLRDSHVLFHPSRAESFCMVILEAAASGLAVVTSRGRALPHMDEMLGEGEGLLVDRDGLDPEMEELTYQEALQCLIGNPTRARTMALAAYESVISGPLSVGHRNKLLSELYRQAEAEPAAEAFSEGRWGLPDHRLALSSDQVLSGQRSFLAAGRITKSNFYVEGGAFPQKKSLPGT